jgi:hypothetical protein
MTHARRLAGVVISALIWIGASGVALACPICFQMEDGPMTKGVIAALFVLLTITVGVLGAFARFVLRIAKAERAGHA